MEFKNLTSSPEAISELNRRLGLHKVKPRNPKNQKEIIIHSLDRASKLSKKVLKSLKSIVSDPVLISDYVATVGRFTAISEKLINEIGGNLDVKEDIKTP